MGLSVIQKLSLWLYGWLMLALVPFLIIRLKFRERLEPTYGLRYKQRLGYYSGIEPSSGWIWIHAVSLGETRAAGILIRALKDIDPSVRILLTHGTATGWDEGQKLLSRNDCQVWQPWDTPQCVRRFLHHFSPRMGVLLETEVWPHWVHACDQAGIPLHLVNARLSIKSHRTALKFSLLTQPAYCLLSSVMAQTDEDADRLQSLGAKRCLLMGNLKYDVEIDPELKHLGNTWRSYSPRPVIILASSREGEELLWVRAIKQLDTKAVEQVQWLIVPRHPQRFDKVEELLRSSGWNVSRRSHWPQRPPSIADVKTVWLGDSLGEMQAYYHLATVAWLGGSFEPLGGQNFMEAAASGCCVVLGPHTFNFERAAQEAIRCGAAIRVGHMTDAWYETITLLEHPHRLEKAQRAATKWINHSQGAAKRCAGQLLRNSSPPFFDLT